MSLAFSMTDPALQAGPSNAGVAQNKDDRQIMPPPAIPASVVKVASKAPPKSSKPKRPKFRKMCDNPALMAYGTPFVPDTTLRMRQVRGVIDQIMKKSRAYLKDINKDDDDDPSNDGLQMKMFLENPNEEFQGWLQLKVQLRMAFDVASNDLTGGARNEVSMTFWKIYRLGHSCIPESWRTGILTETDKLVGQVVKKYLTGVKSIDGETNVKTVAKQFGDLVFGSSKSFKCGLSLQSLDIMALLFNALLPDSKFESQSGQDLKNQIRDLRLSMPLLKMMKDCLDSWESLYQKKNILHVPSKSRVKQLRSKINSLDKYLEEKMQYCFRTLPMLALIISDIGFSLRRLETRLETRLERRQKHRRAKEKPTSPVKLSQQLNSIVHGKEVTAGNYQKEAGDEFLPNIAEESKPSKTTVKRRKAVTAV